MADKWNEKELKKKLLLSRLALSKRDIEIYKNLLAVFNNRYSKDTIDIRNNDKLNLNDARLYFIAAMEYIPDDIYEGIITLFLRYLDFSIFNYIPDYSELKISNQELFYIGYNIITQFNDAELLRYYQYLIYNNKINVVENNPENTTTKTERVGGFTTSSILFHESYINIFRTNTIEDIEILVHEVMHAYFFHINRKNARAFHRLPELEGQLGSQATIEYLTRIKHKDANKLRTLTHNSMLTRSFLMMINHALLVNGYDLAKTNAYLNEQDEDLQVEVLEEELEDYLTIQGFQTSSNLISYLSILDIITKNEDPVELFKKAKSLKLKDTLPIEEALKTEPDITFYKDDYHNFQEEYKRIRIKK